MRIARALFVLLSISLAGCGPGKKTTEDDPKVANQTTPDGPGTHPTMGESKCHGNRVPPTNYQQATAFVPAGDPNATEEAKQQAVRELRDRICQGYRCSALEPKITLWNTDRDGMQVCAMAVVKASDVEEFKQAPRTKLEADLETRAAQLVANVTRKQGEPRIGIDNVRDVGVDGGPRAEWLIDRMNAALSKNGALLARIPPDWSGLGLPRGVDAVLRGRITPMHGQEAMLEVTWNIELGHGMKAVDAIAFPELIGPSINPLTHLPDLAGINPAVSLRFDARPGGALCNGQTTELRLETADDLHVRVVNLFGEGDRGMVIYASKDKLAPRQPTSLGEFQVVKATDVPVERFLVLGAKAKSGLGALASVQAPCRIPTELATQLSGGRGVPDGARNYTTSRSYRIIEGEDCSSFSPQTMPAGWYEALPLCF